jgi:hypothetical protein
MALCPLCFSDIFDNLDKTLRAEHAVAQFLAHEESGDKAPKVFNLALGVNFDPRGEVGPQGVTLFPRG